MYKSSCVSSLQASKSSKPASPKVLLGAFNTWAFKREQPEQPDLLQTCVTRAIETQSPLPFVLYWGKGPRAEVAAPDEQCLLFLASMADRIAKVHAPGAQLEVLFTDTHARLNGHVESAINSYFRGVADLADELGFSHRRLSDVVAAAGAIKLDHTSPPAEAVLQPLIATSAKWYRGSGSPRDGAVAYYAQNMIERVAVERAYPNAIFISFNNSQMRDLFPEQMPVFYMYSLRKGIAVKPWFIGSDRQPFADVDDARARGVAVSTAI